MKITLRSFLQRPRPDARPNTATLQGRRSTGASTKARSGWTPRLRCRYASSPNGGVQGGVPLRPQNVESGPSAWEPSVRFLGHEGMREGAVGGLRCSCCVHASQLSSAAVKTYAKRPLYFIPTILPRVRPRDYWLMSEATDEQIRQLAEASEGAEMSCGVSGSAYHMGLR